MTNVMNFNHGHTENMTDEEQKALQKKAVALSKTPTLTSDLDVRVKHVGQQERLKLVIGNIPIETLEAFDDEADRLGVSKRELLSMLLIHWGIDVLDLRHLNPQRAGMRKKRK